MNPMSEPYASAAFAMHGPEWWALALMLLLLAVSVGLFGFFVYLLWRALARGLQRHAPARDSDDPKPTAGGRPTT